MSTGAFTLRRGGVTVQVLLLCAASVAAAVWLASRGLQAHHALTYSIIPALLVPAVLWLFFSERYAVTLAVLLAYLGLVDGAFKLASGSSVATLGRDVLLYAIALGAAARMILKKTPLTMPPFAGLVLAWVAVCVVQVANPSDHSIVHAMAALRPQLEFVPLFFFGYFVMRTERRLLGLLILLAVVAAANGIVSLIQSGLTADQLASWGPGYAKLATGTTTVARTFVVDGQVHVRPPGLGGTDGFGGLVSLIAVPALIALLSTARQTVRFGWLLIPAAVLTIVGIVSSQARLSVVDSVLALVAFLALTLRARRGLVVLLVAAAIGLVGYAAVTSFVTQNANRYSTIAPSRVLGTSISARSGSLAVIPTYIADFPLGAGIGSVGPAGASSIGGASNSSTLNGETEVTFLLVETGIPGLLVMLTFSLAVVRAGLVLRRLADPTLQRSLMAITATVISISVAWIIVPVTAESPTSPFLWLSGGCLAYWYSEMRAGRLRSGPRRLRASLAWR